MTNEERLDLCAEEDIAAGKERCYRCWKYFNKDELTKINSIFGEKVCLDCRHKYYKKCFWCKEWDTKEEMIYNKGHLIDFYSCQKCSIMEE